MTAAVVVVASPHPPSEEVVDHVPHPTPTHLPGILQPILTEVPRDGECLDPFLKKTPQKKSLNFNREMCLYMVEVV